MRIILDTSVWFDRNALGALYKLLGSEVIVPAIVFTERARQLERDGRTNPLRLLKEIEDFGWSIESYGPGEAMAFATSVTDDKKWRKLARDAMIAGHVGRKDRLWTANGRDFLMVGVPKTCIVDINKIKDP